ncbi:MAG: primosomal protein N' [Marinilabiliales bacterium]
MSDLYRFADIILPLPLEKLFTYEIPPGLINSVREGMRVTVQFGKKKIYTGLIRNIHNNKPEYETKLLLEVLDNKPIVNEIHFKFWEWIAQYYMCSLGEVYKAALPSGLKLESESVIIYNGLENPGICNEDELLAARILEKENILKIDKFRLIFKKLSANKILKSLLEKNIIVIEEKLRETYKPKSEKFIRLNSEFSDKESINKLLLGLQKAPAQFKLLMVFLEMSGFFKSGNVELTQSELLKKAGVSSGIIKSLIDKKIIEVYNQEVSRIAMDVTDVILPNKLNEDQKQAYHEIIKNFETNDVCLLHGVTSSGKTEIYIHLIADTLKKGKQVLYLLPEIALTAQIINRLKRIFGNKVGVYHSKFSDSERVETWNKISNDEDYEIILGVRSSLFLPFSRLGLIIIDEEHENTYKQFDPAPRYNARDSAVFLAKLLGIKVLLGTATPSLESFYNCQTNNFALVNLPKRYLDIQMPEIVVVDTREAKKANKMNGHFSEYLIGQIDAAMSRGEQVILFQNRRGFSPFIECEICGWIPKCTQCDVSLTYHKNINKLVCHYCGFTKKTPVKCDACGNISLRTKGFGTEKIEEEIQLLYPDKTIARLDLDTTRSRKSYEKIISAFETGNIDILIGTQMVTKGLDFDNVSVVGILNADNMLHFPDFRSYERSFQLMSQVSGRAGRKHKQGLVIIQTSDKDHFIINCVRNNDYESMFQSQLAERKEFKYPPYYRLMKILIKHKDRQLVNNASDYFASRLRSVFGQRVLGPEYPVIARIQNKYIKQIILKVERDKSSNKAKVLLKNEIQKLQAIDKFRSVQIVIDVDPM